MQIRIQQNIKYPVLALGAQAKNTLCFLNKNTAYLSRVHTDLNDYRDFVKFKKDAAYFLRRNPRIIACDLHPDYQSTKFALDIGHRRLCKVQHHHAHLASCMAENSLPNQKVIGVAFDGTGLGSDNTLWGAEFFICNYNNFQRAAHLEYVPLVGAEKAILEPWRLSAMWLYQIYKDRFLNLGIEFSRKIKKNDWGILKKMYLTHFNSLPASSAGRLFDAAASIILNRDRVSYEAQLAIDLEKVASGYQGKATSYSFKIIKKDHVYILDPKPIFLQVVLDLKKKKPQAEIAYSFHLTVAEMIEKTCLGLRKDTFINKIILSGGVFQNKLLLRLTSGLLYKAGFQVFTHNLLPCNDSSISLGQAIVAGYRSR